MSRWGDFIWKWRNRVVGALLVGLLWMVEVIIWMVVGVVIILRIISWPFRRLFK